ncbi:polysialyltransferase family glycosyltransferase [Vibrio chaetopteri]|uniref:polysialyltransferase family glycosyltransferase n=1 Tax=Vibrio chaetopteri TaxID=3016528 RepID=UPI003AB26016
MKLMVLNSPEQISPFTKDVFSSLGCEGYLFNEKTDGEIINKESVVYYYGDKLPEKTSLIIFDVFLVPTLVVLKKYRHLKFIFIQHGLFSDLTIESRNKKRTLDWYKRSTIIAKRFLDNFGFTMSNIAILLRIMRSGPWSQRDNLNELGLRVDHAIFWNKLDFENILTSFPHLICKHTLTLPPDFDKIKIKYNANAPCVYISQPLVEDGIVSSEEYLNFTAKLRTKHDDVIIIRHPRQKIISNNDRLLSEVDEVLETSGVIGHFSSLLLSIGINIPVEYECFDKASIQSYSKYIELSRQSLDKNFIKFHEALKNEL